MVLNLISKSIKTFNLWLMHESSIVIYIESLGKYRDTYRIVSWLYRYSHTTLGSKLYLFKF